MRFLPALTALSLTTLGVAVASPPAVAGGGAPALGPTASGYGGAVATVDPTATAVGLDVLRRGGNAVDAAVAAAATLGVTEPFSAGIGGGGFFFYNTPKRHSSPTTAGRGAGPATMPSTSFTDPADGKPYDFQEARVSGLSAGVPGTLAPWEAAARRWGTKSLGTLLRPAADVAD